MTAPPHQRRVVVHADPVLLADATAERLLLRLVDAQSMRSPVHVVLTGGTMGIAVLRAAAQSVLRDAVDWSDVHVWWGDERFLATGDPERNETQARAAFLDDLDGTLPAVNVHPIPGPDQVATPEESALVYAAALAEHTSGTRDVPAFDVVLLGVGPDGHVASLFPGQPTVELTGTPTAAVHDSPKPPLTRVSLTFDAINRAQQVWLVVAGADKAGPVAAALRGAAPQELPASGVHGRSRTLWLLDVAAASAIEH